MIIPIYQVDAFTNRAFGGNPAAVCPLDGFPGDDRLQSIALENNLSETAFIVPLAQDGSGGDADYHLRWFTPGVEVALCGHATLAAAHVVFTHLQPELDAVQFETKSGMLTVTRKITRLANKPITETQIGKITVTEQWLYQMDFPALTPFPIETPVGLGAAMGVEPLHVLKSKQADRDLLLVYDNVDIIRDLTPNLEALKAFAPYGFIATASENVQYTRSDVDFVSRCFFPNHGVGEDPVTGSAHCVSGPYWATKLGKTKLFAQQISERGGDLWLEVAGDRVLISGQAVEVMRGTLTLPG